MSSKTQMDAVTRQKLIAEPEVLLDDKELMRALVAANDRAMGPNIVDMRGIAMDRLEARLDRLEDTHRTVIAAAYDNLAGTNQIQRAVLRLLEPTKFDTFLTDLSEDVAAILRVDALRLVLETRSVNDPAAARVQSVLTLAEPGFADRYIGRGRPSTRAVTLRPVTHPEPEIFGPRHAEIRSEACLRLDLGPGRLPGLLILGSVDPDKFSPQQGTDLLGFFTGVTERAMRRWLEE